MWWPWTFWSSQWTCIRGPTHGKGLVSCLHSGWSKQSHWQTTPWAGHTLCILIRVFKALQRWCCKLSWGSGLRTRNGEAAASTSGSRPPATSTTHQARQHSVVPSHTRVLLIITTRTEALSYTRVPRSSQTTCIGTSYTSEEGIISQMTIPQSFATKSHLRQRASVTTALTTSAPHFGLAPAVLPEGPRGWLLQSGTLEQCWLWYGLPCEWLSKYMCLWNVVWH